MTPLDQKLTTIAARHGIDTIPAGQLALLVAIYHEGRMDGALAAAHLVANQAPAQRQTRLDRFEGDLPLARTRHPDINFDKPFKLHGTFYTIVGYNTRAPQNPFIIKGPQGGTYKCSTGAVVRGQQS